MRALAVALAIASCAFDGFLVARSHAQGSGTFALRVCNASGLDVAMALVTAISSTDSRYHVHGWYSVNATSRCQDLGSWPKSTYFYWYAQEEGANASQFAVWEGTVTK